ncbi:MAG: glycerophosphoryl diester phosphodiesterase membrane domain-containing protein [Anaerolineales bacterium]|nr:glycerophosphoryl diester phosphodiesterase membrane domain-containing protein [Anaerolineales bacterium]
MVTFFGPWDLGKLLGDTFSTYGKKWYYYIAIVSPFIIVTALISWALGATIAQWQDLADLYNSSELAFRTLFIALGLILLEMLIGMIVEVVMNCIFIHAMCQHYITNQISLGKAYRETIKKLTTVILAILLRGIVIAALSITIIGIPVAIYFAIKWLFITHAILLEGKGISEALSRSSQLTSNNWWRIFGYIILLLIITISFGFILGFISQYFNFGTAVNDFDFGITILSIIAAPITIIATTLLYFTLRVEKEGYHLGKLKVDLDAFGANKRPVYPADVTLGQFYCSRCGTRQATGTRLCINCGKPFYEDAAPPEAKNDKPQNSDDEDSGPFIS